MPVHGAHAIVHCSSWWESREQPPPTPPPPQEKFVINKSFDGWVPEVGTLGIISDSANEDE